MGSLTDKLEHARFWDLDVSRKNDGRISEVEAAVAASGSSNSRRVTLRYTAKRDGTVLRLTHVADFAGNRLLVDDMMWAVAFAEALLADRIPDVEAVEKLEARCGSAREDAAEIEDLGDR